MGTVRRGEEVSASGGSAWLFLATSGFPHCLPRQVTTVREMALGPSCVAAVMYI